MTAQQRAARLSIISMFLRRLVPRCTEARAWARQVPCSRDLRAYARKLDALYVLFVTERWYLPFADAGRVEINR